jgi:hypothetical protein
VPSILVERARAVEGLLVLLIIVALGMRFTNSGDDVVWPAATVLTRLGSFWLIMASVVVMAVVVMAVIVASAVGAVVVAASWAMSAHIFVEGHLGFLGISVLVGNRDHLTNPYGHLVVELGAKLMVMESSDEGGDDLGFHDVGNRIPHLEKALDVAMKELEQLLVDAV